MNETSLLLHGDKSVSHFLLGSSSLWASVWGAPLRIKQVGLDIHLQMTIYHLLPSYLWQWVNLHMNGTESTGLIHNSPKLPNCPPSIVKQDSGWIKITFCQSPKIAGIRAWKQGRKQGCTKRKKFTYARCRRLNIYNNAYIIQSKKLTNVYKGINTMYQMRIYMTWVRKFTHALSSWVCAAYA